jgi:tetratricopeptide (TPR) repeat protein
MLLITFSILTILILGSAGTVLGFSLKTKSEGDALYKNAKYQQALTTYLKAKDLWFPWKISTAFRDRDLYTKIAVTRVMVQSNDDFQKGKEAFDKGQYAEARSYLFKVVANDPNKSQAQEMISMTTGATSKKNTSTNQPKPSNTIAKAQTPIPTPIPFTSPTFPPTPTPAPPTYNDLHCPKIVNIQDSLGNSSTTFVLRGTFKKGSISSITLKANITDPNNLPLRYQFYWLNNLNQSYSAFGTWQTDNTYTIDLSDPSKVSVGSSRNVLVYIDNQDGYDCSVSYDGVLDFVYDITP